MNICIWRGTALRGCYQPGCEDEPKMTGVPPPKGSDCPYCGRAYVMDAPPKRGADPTTCSAPVKTPISTGEKP